MVRKCFAVLMSFIFVAMIAGVASATYLADITYDYVDNGGGNYTFTFTVYNNSTGSDSAALDFFEIDFDADANYDNYSNITWVVDNGWYSEAYEPTSGFGGVPGCALADDSIFGSDGGGIAQGDSLGGFKVEFDYTGSLDPEDQLFSFYVNFGTSDTDNGGTDMGGYWVLGEYSGTTEYEPSGPAPIPEPGTIFLVGAGLIGLLGASRKKLNKGV